MIRPSAISSRSLAEQLALLVLATALPLILLAVFMFSLLVSNERNSIRQNLVVNAQTLAGLVDNEIDTHAAIASTLAHSPALQNGDLAAFREEVERSLEFLPDSWLSLSTPEGQRLMSTITMPGVPLPKHVDPEIISRAFSERRLQVSDLVFGPVSQRWTAFIEVPVFRDNVPVYSISISLSPSRFLSLLSTRFKRGEVVAIVDRNKKFVARLPDHDARVGTLSSEGWRAAMAKAPTGWTENKTVEGDWSLTGYAQTQHGWTAGIAQLESDISEPINKIAWLVGLTAGALILISLTLAALIARRASHGMTALASSALQLGEGQVVAAPPAPFSEAFTIGVALAQASLELKRREDLLARHQRELESEVAQRTSALVSEMRRREEVETLLRQMQKIEAVGQLTGGIAHDFNNMLAIIIGSLRLMQRRIEKGDTNVQRFIDSARDGAERAAALTQRLLAFSRQQPLSPEPIDANKLLAGMSDMLRRTITEDVKIETVLAGGLWRTHADPNQLENAILNLAVNGRDAMLEGGKITIETANCHLDDSYASTHAEVSPGQYVLIAVTDTGRGMPVHIIERVFEPFFTTKPTGQGTGLGLSQVYGFVKQSGGHVKIYSEVGHGTTVKLYLPRFFGTTEARTQPREQTDLPIADGQQMVLVVEDEDNVRALTVESLGELGYRVLEASGAAEALRLLDANPEISLLFTDVVMPDVNGRKLADEALKRKLDLKVLFTTGYTRNAIVHNGVLDPDVQLIIKPFTLEQLAVKVAEVLYSQRR